jgi:hypothetical protein
MSTSFTVTVVMNNPYFFTAAAFNTAEVTVYDSLLQIVFTDNTVFFTGSNTTKTSEVLLAIIPPGSYTIRVTLPNNVTSNAPVGTGIANFTATFLPGGEISSDGIIAATEILGRPSSGLPGGMDASITILCLHGSSMIKVKDGDKRLDQVKIGDEVLTGQNVYAKVKNIAQCWLTFMGTDHDAIIFEPNSLGPNEPIQRLIIDPGHPICTQKEYNKKGIEALRPAGSFWEELKGDKVYTKKWIDIFVQEEPSVRYDLILQEPHNTYIANEIVVRSKGYKDHRYKHFV